ncbi:YhgE/Pip domain-containing protein [Methanobrevibacter thaueri]|uniref:ABC-2 family transporter protein n=1 Tax=Methanobrevibacter thaueri TaxID=190975 RepID=A0A315XLR8_9EURY|nr:YhgE/Pip domain-containing protein [Methanobrevibacter thaueri]PWB87174.1 ABC-2 family transporter protein [Methanobrevibacter thaueri]
MGERNVNKVLEIIRNDFKSAFSNPIVTIILVGLIILPSLYALINIDACWDPYGNTGQVEFAIANLDKGATFDGNKINVGNELVKDLKDNDKFKWTFVTEDELRDGVYKGDYYAGIIIPKNLSKNIISITGDNPKQAKLEYIVNMKANPVGAKLTDSGSNAVYNALNAKIVEIINLAAYGKLGELQEGLASGADQLASGGNQLAAGSAQVASGADQVSSGADQVKDGASQVKDGASQVQKGAKDVNNGADAVQKGSTAVKDGASKVEQGSEEIQSAIDPSLIPDGPVKDYVNGNVELANGSGEVANGAGKLADGSVDLAKGSSKLANGSSKVAGGASDLADGSVQLAEGSLALAAGSQLLSNAATQALFAASGALGASADSLADITGINETILGDYFYAPVKLDRHEIFPTPDYGSQVSPFYLVLSMWVGALITCAMLKPGTSTGTKYTPLEMYFGKSVLFLIMGLLQSCVTIIGAHILGIYIANEAMFILSCLTVSGVFMILVYSLVSALGNVGKAVAIVLLVLQISGTGGIYPVEIMSPIFNILNPYLPMTYAITLIREAQLGLIWSNFIPALIILFALGIVTVIVSIIIKEKADKATHYFENKLEESGLF